MKIVNKTNLKLDLDKAEQSVYIDESTGALMLSLKVNDVSIWNRYMRKEKIKKIFNK